MRISRVQPHLTQAEIEEKIKGAQNFRQQQKWWIIYNALVDPRTAQEMAKHTGTTVRLVHQVICDYNRWGVAAIETPERGGRHRSYLSLEEEKAFLEPFKERAKRGEVVTIASIQKALEEQLAIRLTPAPFIASFIARDGVKSPLVRVTPKQTP